MEAAEGLFFDGIQGQGGEESIIVRADLPLPMAPGPAETGLSRGQLSVMGTEGAGEEGLRFRHLCLTTWNRNKLTGSLAAIFPF